MRTLITGAALLLSSMAVLAADVGDARVVTEIKATTAKWIGAFNTRDAQSVADLYASDAVFWGTVSPTIRMTPDKVLEYFQASSTRNPNMRIGVKDQHVRVYGDTATNSGIYVTHNPRPGEDDAVSVSRFTFVYQRQGNDWVIVSHHSSRMPSP